MVSQKQLHKWMGIAKLVGNVATCGAIPSEADKNWCSEWQDLRLCVQVKAFLCFGVVQFGL